MTQATSGRTVCYKSENVHEHYSPPRITTQKTVKMSLLIKNMSFKQGQEMKITVLPKSGNSGFSINIGHDTDNYALHMNPRFDDGVVVCNSLSGGSWGDECREGNCPFTEGSDNKVSISFNMDAFDIRLPDGNTISFPNRLGDVKYGHIEVIGEARLVGLKIK